MTAALSAAFLTAFVTSPIRRIWAMARRREDLTIPLLVEREEYESAAETVRETLERGGMPTRREEPPWLLTAPSRVLRGLGSRTLKDRIPKDLRFYRGKDIDVVVNPNGVTVQAEKERAARAHALISEKATLGPGLQTVESEAQKLERRVKDVWMVFARDRRSHARSDVLLGRLDEIAKELAETYVPFDDWQVLYREILQVARAIRGRPQLLGTERGESMSEERRPENQWPPRPGRRVSALSTPQLVAGLTAEMRELVRKEVDLAKAELRVDLKAEAKSAKWLGLAAVMALCFLNMLFVAAALLVARWISPPLAALVVAAGAAAADGPVRDARPRLSGEADGVDTPDFERELGMGKEPDRVSGADVREQVSSSPERRRRSPETRKAESPRDLKRLEWEIARSRRRLDEYVDELDRRRHRLLAVREHPVAVAGAALGAVAAIAGAVILIRRRSSTRRRAATRSQDLKDALNRMFAHPERVASDGKSPWSRVLVAVAPIVAKKIADAAFRRR